MEKELFNDLVAACNEIIEHQRGNIKLNSYFATIPDDELELEQIISVQLSKLSKENKQKIMRYANELLQY